MLVAITVSTAELQLVPSNSSILEEELFKEETTTTIPKPLNMKQNMATFPGEEVVMEMSTSTIETLPSTIQETDILPETLLETVPATIPETLPQTASDNTSKTIQETVSVSKTEIEMNISPTIKATATEDQDYKIPSTDFPQINETYKETSTVSKEIIPINATRTERMASITSTKSFFPNTVAKSVPISELTMLVPPTQHLPMREKFVVSVEKSEILGQDGSTIMDHPWDPEQNLTLISDQSTQVETVTLSTPFIANPNIERKQNQRPRTPKVISFQDRKSPNDDMVSFPHTLKTECYLLMYVVQYVKYNIFESFINTCRPQRLQKLLKSNTKKTVD